jgi:cytochrome c553
MHVVGDTPFARGGHKSLARSNLSACAACHGARGQGAVLARAAVERTLVTKGRKTFTVAQGQPIHCAMCHSNPLARGGNN